MALEIVPPANTLTSFPDPSDYFWIVQSSVVKALDAGTIFGTDVGALIRGTRYVSTAASITDHGVSVAGSLKAQVDAAQSAGGGVIFLPPGTFPINTLNALLIDTDNVWIIGSGRGLSVLDLTGTPITGGGYGLWWAHGADTEGGGAMRFSMQGRADLTSGGNGGMLFGYDVGATHVYANRFTVDDVEISEFAQYGLGVYSGSSWAIRNTRIREHGYTAYNPGSCIALFVYPRTTDSQRGRVSDVYAEISDDSVSYGANSAAIKLQIHRRLETDHLHAHGGTEVVMVVDSTDQGVCRDTRVEGKGATPGFNVSGWNPDVDSPTGIYGTAKIYGADIFGTLGAQNSFALTGQSSNTQHELDGWTIWDVRSTSGISANDYATFKNCSFKRWRGTTVSLVPGTKHATLVNENNETHEIEATAGNVVLGGSGCRHYHPASRGASAAGVVADGDGNRYYRPHSENAGTYGVWFKSTSDDCVVVDPQVVNPGGTPIVNSGGTGNRVEGWVLPTQEESIEFDLSTATEEEQDVTVAGTTAGDHVDVALPSSVPTGSSFIWWAPSANTVRIRASRTDPATGVAAFTRTYAVTVTKRL